MSAAGISDRVRGIVAENFGITPDECEPQKAFRSDLAADSLDVIIMATAIEEEFALIEIEDDQLLECETVADMIALVETAIGGASVRHLFTIGHRESYEQFFDEFPAVTKLGKGPHPRAAGRTYGGGSVYLTYDEAKAACPPGYQPYGLLTDIESTYQSDGNRYLIESALLCKLNAAGEFIS